MIYILVAKTEQQELFYLTGKHTRTELREMRQRKQFFCPSCKAPLRLKIGEINIPHFAHQTRTDCDTFSEPESSLHLQGKLLLYKFFSQLNLKAELESYLPQIRQRADLLVNRHLAIEFQCSTIPVQQLKQRSEGYLKMKLKPVWIKGLKESCPEGISLLGLKTHEIEMRQNVAETFFILLFYPPDNRFYYHSSLFYVSSNRWVGKTKSIEASKQVFPFAIPKLLTKEEFNKVLGIFQNVRQQYIRSQLYNENRIKSLYCRLCYELQLDMANLPAHFGIPLLGAECLKQPAVLWQLQAAAAWEKGISVDGLIASGKLVLSDPSRAPEATEIMSRYLDLYLLLKEGFSKDSSFLEITYDNYCKNLRKLRK
ncbi:competence protein CoiA [Planomicrobium stackebrandtii]|uniref:Competence protein CoiA n=1 Tax=Planomicrobium stackebrandtii TaxID=253160 RepID=A0ABU0GX01_9BACL|nr:competence protein CoiA family protein [Planomicrobium stackebrandtii]MDQ0429070.1 competence protein CoiA [Planomicrobium stackebrandtii]